MRQLSGFSYAELSFGNEAQVVDRRGFDELLTEVAGDDPVDVVVFAHGWNNDMDDARRLYTGLVAQLRTVLDTTPPAGLDGRRFAVLGVFWPSKRFADDDDLIPGGAAGTGGPAAGADLLARLDELQGAFDADDADDRLARAKELVPSLEDSAQARDEFVELIRGVMTHLTDDDSDDLPDEYRTLAGRVALDRLKPPMTARPRRRAGGGAAGGAASEERHPEAQGGAAARTSRSGFAAAAQRFLNMTTYYQMKQRAGEIGERGLNPRLREVREKAPAARLHLVGHSFGGRLVTAATVGVPGQPAVEPDTVTLLQAAFSHYGFASNYDPGKDGFFRRMVSDQMTRGPVIVTHSTRDSAVGSAYPMASRLAGFAAAALGDSHDRYGGIGRNGAQKTPEAISRRLQEAGDPYELAADRIYNLNADAVISDHSDIQGPQVAYAVLSAIAAETPSG